MAGEVAKCLVCPRACTEAHSEKKLNTGFSWIIFHHNQEVECAICVALASDSKKAERFNKHSATYKAVTSKLQECKRLAHIKVKLDPQSTCLLCRLCQIMEENEAIEKNVCE